MKQVFKETSFILALKNIQQFSHMMTEHVKTLISIREKQKKKIKT